MTDNQLHIRISDYDYPLPDSRIARYPLAERDTSKLLIYNKGEISHRTFSDLPDLIPEGELMVFNNTRVIQARLHFRKETGALIEVFLLEPHAPADYEQMFQTDSQCEWLCLVGNLKKWKGGILSRRFNVGTTTVTLTVERLGVKGNSHIVRFGWDNNAVHFADILDAAGELPIPPYLNRDTEESDKTTYQTVYSKIKGSVAAPTAGLHFTPAVLQRLDERGVERAELTLHVGAGTFRPVKTEDISGHSMHTEYISVNKGILERLLAHRCKATAVGTTSVRTLESLYYIGCHILAHPEAVTDDDLHVRQWEPYQTLCADTSHTPTPPSAEDAVRAVAAYLDRNGMEVLHASTQIIIAPGYEYKIVRRLITNFHQPKSTLLLLVSALVGERWHDIYDYALDNGFRFLSYGDSSLLIP